MDDFIKYVNEARQDFVDKINTQQWNTEMRTAAEDLLIAYDQMVEKLCPSNFVKCPKCGGNDIFHFNMNHFKCRKCKQQYKD